MTPEKRLWLAVALCMAIVFMWEMLFPTPKAPKKAKKAIAADTRPAELKPETVPVVIANSYNDTVAQLELSRPNVALDFKLPEYDWTVFETGGIVAKVDFSRFDCVQQDFSAKKVNLVSHLRGQAGHLAVMMDRQDRSGLSQVRWSAESGPESVSLRARPRIPELPEGIELEKALQFRDRFSAELVFRIRNRTSHAVSFSTAKLENKLYERSSEGSFVIHLGPDMGINAPHPLYQDQYLVTGAYGHQGKLGTPTVEKSFSHSFFGLPDLPRDLDWVALQNRYFTIAVLPEGYKIEAAFTLDKERRLHAWMLLPAFALDPGAEKSFRFKCFSGPKETRLLSAIDPIMTPLDGMEPNVLPSRISFARWMVGLLAWIQGMVGNWGVAIICLTLLVRIILFPLSYYQFRSMAKMQKLRPQIEAVQQQYANDKERMQRELMKLYGEAGFNPFGGCLPIFIQMPVLVGLFISLQHSIDLRGVPFIWWIKDLSAPDTLFWIMGVPINPLPIVMTVTMILQQKMTPSPTVDKAQQQMFTIMIVVMSLMFYNFPSGLALYWLVQNLLAMGQQYVMMKKK